jgi:hypothetical protein
MSPYITQSQLFPSLCIVASGPTSLRYVVQDDGTSVNLTWSPVEDTTGYRISYTGASSGSETVSGGDTDSHTLTGLTSGEIYSISIVALGQHFPRESAEWKPVRLIGGTAG